MPPSIPRFLLPRGPLTPSRPLQALHRSLHPPLPSPAQHCRHATSNPSAKPGAPKPWTLEKPDKFRPPSHESRPRVANPTEFSSQLTEAQKKRKYPHIPGADPVEGTFMFWFLSNTDLHLFISLGTLFTLGGIAWYENYHRDTAFRSTLPGWDEFAANPLQWWKDMVWLWKLSTWETSQAVAQMRNDDNTNDAQKRNSWRKYHGIEDKQGLGPWMPTEEVLKEWEERKRLRGEVEPKRVRPKWILGINWGD